MAGVTVTYSAGKFEWKYTPPPVPPAYPATELRLRVSPTPNQVPASVIKIYGVATLGANVQDVLQAGSLGQFYATMAVWNGHEEGPVSAEVPFVLSAGAAGGSITFSVS